ncbi:MAG: hypothetical protein R2788_17575 [Saprospiraceae bacterium]
MIGDLTFILPIISPPATASHLKNASSQGRNIIPTDVPEQKIAVDTIDILQISHPDAVMERYKLLLARAFPLG